jgi:hypothetical protein
VALSNQGGFGVPLWLAGVIGFFAYRSGRRRGADSAAGPGRGGAPGVGSSDLPDALGPLREVRLPDGRAALQAHVSLFTPDEDDSEVWRWVALEGVAVCQEAVALTVAESAPGAGVVEDVPVVLLPLGARGHITAVDAYATGGRLGALPGSEVRAVGEAIWATHHASGQACAVLGRVVPDAGGQPGVLGVEVLMPETFEPGPPEVSGGRVA